MPIWKGSLTLGLLNVPVELHAAVRPDHISFRLLDSDDNTPVKYERVREDDRKPVAWGDIVKGYEYAKDKFVVLTPAEFKSAALEQTNIIDVMDFVPKETIDPRYFETPYFLVPAKTATKTYAVLREAMRAMDSVGIGTMILRKSGHLVGVHVVGDALVLDIMRFSNEIVPPGDYSFPKRDVRATELSMAKQLLQTLKTDFEPEKYVNTYQANLMRIIRSKSKGKTVTLKKPEEKANGKVLDLMSRLQASIGESTARKAKKSGDDAGAKRKTPARKPTHLRLMKSKPAKTAARRTAQKRSA